MVEMGDAADEGHAAVVTTLQPQSATVEFLSNGTIGDRSLSYRLVRAQPVPRLRSFLEYSGYSFEAAWQRGFLSLIEKSCPCDRSAEVRIFCTSLVTYLATAADLCLLILVFVSWKLLQFPVSPEQANGMDAVVEAHSSLAAPSTARPQSLNLHLTVPASIGATGRPHSGSNPSPITPGQLDFNERNALENGRPTSLFGNRPQSIVGNIPVNPHMFQELDQAEKIGILKALFSVCG
jgi:hypothetical protein